MENVGSAKTVRCNKAVNLDFLEEKSGRYRFISDWKTIVIWKISLADVTAWGKKKKRLKTDVAFRTALNLTSTYLWSRLANERKLNFSDNFPCQPLYSGDVIRYWRLFFFFWHKRTSYKHSLPSQLPRHPPFWGRILTWLFDIFKVLA